MTKKNDKEIKTSRPPVIAIMGHIDHGKSTLLDYIRKTNVAESEAGGITQHLSAYEVIHKDESGKERKITFLDTPGHESFQKMRARGTEVADIAVLVVSAEEGVKAQTLEALRSILESKIPYIVAINKVDKPGANIERTKQNLIENEIYLEGLGGSVPYVPISAKAGTGVNELLDMMLLVADLEELSGNKKQNAEGVVIEAHRDPKKGISATLIIKNGTLRKGMFVTAGESIAPVRIMENFLGHALPEACFSSPVRVIGFSSLPTVGARFSSYETKKGAENAIQKKQQVSREIRKTADEEEGGVIIIPLILKADVAGTLDAIEHEIEKLQEEKTQIKVISLGVGAVTEGDIKVAQSKPGALVVAFNTDIDPQAADVAHRSKISIEYFDIIYKLAEWLENIKKKRTPKIETAESTGRAKILKTFNRTKDKQVIGGRMEEGSMSVGDTIKIIRRDMEIGQGKILGLQQQKAESKKVSEGNEFGAQVRARNEITAGDRIESFILVTK